jgi:hypothetical protein
LGRFIAGGAGDMFPRIREDFKEKSSIPQGLPCGCSSEILLTVNKSQINQIIVACYSNEAEEKPLLFDGVGRVYEHTKACFYFFAWLIRDAPQQRLSPLVSRMQKIDNVKKNYC